MSRLTNKVWRSAEFHDPLDIAREYNDEIVLDREIDEMQAIIEGKCSVCKRNEKWEFDEGELCKQCRIDNLHDKEAQAFANFNPERDITND